ncbi:hypothetical protein [Microvirga aerophila]|uniref:Uncharacterized protein n=1 Tax=Microvirga aerophila TaxID=670291 RepID=A0A512BTR2_9HYPH|nr:hypothetical protein [Microvirga aerophila]GEO15332.1 hypothetical protein MAE02_30280 [Microvirga aerophila]
MAKKTPLTDWLSVEISEARLDAEGFGEFGNFWVTNTGEWAESYMNTTPGAEQQPPTDFGHLARWELKTLDRLVDRINQEPIPPPTLVTHVPPPHNYSLVLSNTSRRDPLLYPLIQSFESFGEVPGSNPGTYFAYDDITDVVEISALGAFMGYLEDKYGDKYDVFF